MKKTIAIAAILGCSALLTACGGSGSDGSAAPAPTVTVTESAAAESSTTSTTSPTSSSETTTSSSETTTTTESESGSRGSRGSGSSGGDPALNSDDFPDLVTWADESPDSSSPHPYEVEVEMKKSEAREAGLKYFHIKVRSDNTTGLLTYPTSDYGEMTFFVDVTGLGDSSQLACSIRVFDAGGARVPDSELSGNYRNRNCAHGGGIIPQTTLGFANPGEYTVVFGARSIGKDPAFVAVPVDVVE